MNSTPHGLAVAVFLFGSSALGLIAGCGERGKSMSPAEMARVREALSGSPAGSASGSPFGPAPTENTEKEEEKLPPPELTREVVEQGTLAPPPGLEALKPVAVLPTDEERLLFAVNGPMRLRVVRVGAANGEAVVEADAVGGDILVLDRREGIRLTGRELTRTPLIGSAEYAVYALPPGGVKQESTQVRIRPQTEAERRAIVEAQKKARQEEAEREAQARDAQAEENAREGEDTSEDQPATRPAPQANR